MTNPLFVTRRQLLASSAVVATSAVGLKAFVGQSVALTDSTTAGRLRYRWRETYNGSVRTDTEFFGGDTPGPRLSVGNVLPGDRGTLTLAVEHAEPDDPLALTLSAREYENHENGVTEPESAAGDTDGTGDSGELGRSIRAALWYDEGVLGVEGFGGQNASKEPSERLVAPAATGSLDDVAAALDGGVALAPNRLANDDDCLGAEEAIVVTLGWELPESVGNVIQGDSVSFCLAVTAEYCSGGAQ